MTARNGSQGCLTLKHVTFTFSYSAKSVLNKKEIGKWECQPFPGKQKLCQGTMAFGESRGRWGPENPVSRGDMNGMIYEPRCPGSYFGMLKS